MFVCLSFQFYGPLLTRNTLYSCLFHDLVGNKNKYFFKKMSQTTCFSARFTTYQRSYELADGAFEEERAPIGVFPTAWEAALPISAACPKVNIKSR